MKLQILGWKSRGLRSTDLDIRLEQEGHVPRVSLIQMPNGTGKTTTLNCLRAALTGEGRSWSPDTIKLYAPKDTDVYHGEFELRLQLDGEPLTFGLWFDFEHNKISYTTTYSRGRKEEYHPPPGLDRFLNAHFVNLLVFDGELPGELLDPKVTKAEEALDAFFQLYLLQDAGKALERHWEKATHNKSAKDQKGLTRRYNMAVKCRDRLAKLEQAHANAQEKLLSLTIENDQIRQKIEHQIARSEGDRELNIELDQIIKDKRTELSGSLQGLMNQLRSPVRASPIFGRALQEVRDQLDRLKLPESTSRQFFKELEREDACVCGRLFDDNAREQIRMRADQYLDQDIVGILNSLKNDVSRHVDQQEVFAQDMAFLATSVRQISHEMDGYKTQKLSIQKRLIDGGDEELRQLENAFEVNRQEIGELKELLEEMGRAPHPSDNEECSCLKWWRKYTEDAEHQLAEITQTVELREHKNLLVGILGRAHILSRQRLAKCVIDEMNGQLDTLLPGHDIYVDGLKGSLKLRRQDGASLGQTLAVGYAFLTTLFNRGQHEFPFLVDAPVTALDNRVRQQVAGIIPKVCPQFIGFVLDSERSGFEEEIHKQAEGDVLYLTAFRDSSRNKELLRDLPSQGVSKTKNGVIVRGKEFFDRVAFSPGEGDETG